MRLAAILALLAAVGAAGGARQPQPQTDAPTSLDRLDQKDLPLDHVFRWTHDGAGVNIYVIDTGVRVTHADFSVKDASGRVTGSRARVFADCTGSGAVACGPGPADPSTFDCEPGGYNGHGTHQASLAAGTTYGVAKRANIFAVRAVEDLRRCQGSNPRAVEAALRYIVSHADRSRPGVVNLSFRYTDAGVHRAVLDAVAAGFTVTLSAGGGGDVIGIWSAAVAEKAIIAAATDANDVTGPCDPYGAGLTLFAPGVGMTAAGNRSDADVYHGDAQACVDSFAAPLAAGVAATYLQTNPSASPAAVKAKLVSLAAGGKITRNGAVVADSPNRLLQAF